MKRIILIILAVTTLAQCQKEGDSKNFLVSLVPERPLLHETKRTIGTLQMEPNWFSLTMIFENKTPNAIKIEEVVFYTVVDGVESGPQTFDLGTVKVKVGDALLDYTSYCTYPAGGGAIHLHACRFTDGVAGVGSVSPDFLSIPLEIFIGGITPAQFGVKVISVRLEIAGVYVDSAGRDLDRFDKTVYFTTR